MKSTWRRFSAQQAFLDGLAGRPVPPEGEEEQAKIIADAARDALEVATTVTLTADVIGAYQTARLAAIRLTYDETRYGGQQVSDPARAGLRAAFEAAGFEVVE